MEILFGIISVFKGISSIKGLIEIFIAAWQSYSKGQTEIEFAKRTNERFQLLKNYNKIDNDYRVANDEGKKRELLIKRREAFRKIYQHTNN